MYVFPGIGLGAILSKSVSVTQDMIYASAVALSTALTPSEHAHGWLYPDIRRIREVSVVVTRGVIRAAQQGGVDRELNLRNMPDEELDEYIRARMYDPELVGGKLAEEVAELVAGVQTTKQPVRVTGAASPFVQKGLNGIKGNL